MQAGDAPEAQARRRGMRKGTHSCWECKRRKVRCVFAAPSDAVCIGCTRRCTECVSQEFPDRAATTGRTRLVGDRFVRVEAMIARLAKQTTGTTPEALEQRQATPSRGRDTNLGGIPTPAASDTSTAVTSSDVPSGPSSERLVIPGYFACEDNGPATSLNGPHPQLVLATATTAMLPTGNDKLEEISRSLLAAYPEDKYVDILARSGTRFMNHYQANFKSYREFESKFDCSQDEREDIRQLRLRHTPKTHPVIIAMQMLMLARILQHAESHTLAEIKNLPEEPRALMARLANTAIALVTTNDEMLGTSEGLECLILESQYQADSGNLRLAWLTHRRIIALAQVIGIHRRPHRALRMKSIQANCELDPRLIWYRILSTDRLLSLMLGLPAASLDASMIQEPALSQDTLMGQLERHHCVAAGRILERNDRDPSADDFVYTQRIDTELQRAAGTMPGKWWLQPDLKAVSDDMEFFWESLRLINQLHHFYLLHQLHLPYMLLHSSSPADKRQYDYSRNTCVSASRDILNRCLVFRNHRSFPYGCRTIDFLALMASLTLLLTHLGGERADGSSGSILAHQRLSDRAMIEQALEIMESPDPEDINEPSHNGARMLRQILAIDVNPAMAPGGGWANHADPLRLFVPYFGMIIISRDGSITTEVLTPERAAQDHQQASGDGQRGGGGGFAPMEAGHGALQQQQDGRQPGHDHGVPQPAQQSSRSQVVETGQLGSGPMQHVNDFVPLPTAGADQWALQGIDFAFFDSLMRETSAQTEYDGGGLWSWSGPTGT